MGIRVRVRGLDKLRAVQRTLSNPDAMLAKASEVGAETTLNLISRGFKSGTDPYGSPWNAPNNLQITGALRRYAKRQATKRGWRVGSTDEKAIWHQNPQPRAAWGGKSLPVRLQVPTESRGLPELWRKRLSRAIEESLSQQIKKAV